MGSDRPVIAHFRTDRPMDIERMVSGVLLIGLVSSVALIAAGVVWHWSRTGTLRFDYVLPATNVAGFIGDDVRQAAGLKTGPRRLINLGIAALLMTPYLRVIASMAYFALVARNWKYTLFTGVVLGTLTYTLLR